MNHVVYFIGGPWDLTKRVEEGAYPQKPVLLVHEIGRLSAVPSPGSVIATARIATYLLRQILKDNATGQQIFLAVFDGYET